MMSGRLTGGLSALLLLLLAGCSSGPTLTQGGGSTSQPPITSDDGLVLTPVSFSDLPGWSDDSPSQALPALRRSCDRLTRLQPSQPVGQDGRGGMVADWMGPCGALRSVSENDDQATRSWLQTWFQPYRAAAGSKTEGLFTGYYEAELHGSRRPSARYHVPLYSRPKGLPADPASVGKTYFSRSEIEAGALRGKVAELLWVDDEVDAHILQIQGSGRIQMEDGSVIRVGYDGNNGHKFVGLGKILLDRGKIAPGNSSMQMIRSWLKTHPDEAPALMAQNPRYVFFRLIQGDGPIGAQGVALTPGRSMAVDNRFIPLGAPLWLDSSDPDGLPLRRLMVAQDSGAAIKGAVRGDFFWGPGEAALEKAGRMRSRGWYYLLLPRERTVPVALN